ncbi:MAG: molybdopterin-dependent oxidoreductase [Chloroflexi bacterium]|nr:molybdopterin-dependent oxidoreductase [Chloroflexota bacterium]
MSAAALGKPGEDRWVRTLCGLCYGQCSIRVHVRDGIAIMIEGDPESTYGARGGTCGKALSALQILYDPNRINYPVRRGNPEKGLGVDPRWQRISWDEALGEIADRLGAIRKDNPDKLVTYTSPNNGRVGSCVMLTLGQWRYAFGTRNITEAGAGLHCGDASHLGAGMNHASWSITPDFRYARYIVFFGAGKGVGTGHSMVMVGRERADAVHRGLKVVAFDPICHAAGGKADEWIPILPGTDLLVCLAMANLLVNEWGIYDREFLKQKTNGPYLIKPDGRYLRDDEGEPIMWDLADGIAKNWKVAVKDPALEGEFEVRGVKVRPAFAAIKEHLKQYTPERAEKVSTVPAATIRRVAREFGENANIGATIVIDGVTLPYRPVSAVQFRGGSGHSNGFHAYMAVDLLNHLVGACEVPGGAIGWATRSFGNPWTGGLRYAPIATKDGHLTSTNWPAGFPGTWPHPEPKVPRRLNLSDLFSSCPTFSSFPFNEQSEELYRKFVFPYRAEALFGYGSNMAVTTHELENVEKFLKSVPFMAGSYIFHNETTEGFCDIVLPDTSALESMSAIEADLVHAPPVGMLDHTYPVRNRCVEPMYERRQHEWVLNELAIRMGFSKEYYTQINNVNCTTLGVPPALDVDKLYTWEEICDRILRARFGEAHDLAWFAEHGFAKWPKRVEEAYWRPFVDARSSIYMEFLIDHGREIGELCEPRGIKVDLAQYTPLLSWFPPAIQREKDPDLDLFAFSYKDVVHAGSGTHGLPWLAEISDRNPWHNFIMINRQTAEAKGLKDLDWVYLENARGRKAKGRIHTMEGVHPQCVALIVGAGKFARGMPLARNKGTNMNVLLEGDLDHCCPISLNIETAAKVKIYKATESDPRIVYKASKPRSEMDVVQRPVAGETM